MTIDDIRLRLETIQSDAATALRAIDSLKAVEAQRPADDSERPELPETLDSELVMKHYTRKSYNDLALGLRIGKYPKPFTEPGAKRLWKRDVWDRYIERQQARR